MTLANYPRCLAFTFAEEGGYSDTPGDDGGPTNMGIDQATLTSWRGYPVTAEDVQNLTQTEAAKIYEADFWNDVSGDLLPAGVDLMVFDHAVNVGPSRSAKLLQQLLKVRQDGDIGPQTLAALDTHALDWVITTLGMLQAAYYRSLAQPEFEAGWLARCSRRQVAALGMLVPAAPVTTA